MKYYTYISDSKIEMLYSQLALSEDERREAALGFDLSILKGELKETRGIPTNKFTKLNKVIAKLTESEMIGSIDDDKPYIQASLKMTWAKFEDELDSPITFWGYFSRKLALGLGGSRHHLIGEQPNNAIRSTSSIDAIIHLLEEELAEAFPDVNKEPLPELLRVVYANTDWSSLASFGIWKSTQLPGPRNNYEFIAKVLLRNNAFQYNGQSWKVLLATPLYVALQD